MLYVGTETMKTPAILLLLGVVLVGCKRENQTPVTVNEQEVVAKAQEHIEQLAIGFKEQWLKGNPREAELMILAVILETKETRGGWHVVFERITNVGEPEGESHHFLHVYIDSNGDLERVVRGPDDIT